MELWWAFGMGFILFGHMIGFVRACGGTDTPGPPRGKKLVPITVSTR